ncbi:hypothetical protein [Streptomyces termitum]|uniref:hypothetical protein n=1 Tax=Streptomyces termitum TaxID=67368 RepID=UPI00379DE406
MGVVLGDRDGFGAEVGGSGPLCRVDLWAAGKWLTCDDNMAYVPRFRRDVRETAAWLRSGGGSPPPLACAGLSPGAVHRRLMWCAEDGAGAGAETGERFRFLLWGPTTDNVIACLFREKDRLVVTFEFWREDHLRDHPEDAGVVFVAEVSVREFVGVLDGITAALDAGENP